MNRLKKIDNLWLVKTQQLSVRGIPDLLGCFQGKFFAIELKDHVTSNITELQKYNLDRIRKCGGLAFVWHPENWEEYLEQFFTSQTYEKKRQMASDRKNMHRGTSNRTSKKVYTREDLY